jgi:hypothetical protein
VECVEAKSWKIEDYYEAALKLCWGFTVEIVEAKCGKLPYPGSNLPRILTDFSDKVRI